MDGFRTNDSRVTHEGRVTVRVDTVEAPSGELLEREVVEAIDSVVVVAVRSDGDVVLLRQHRQPAGGALVEVPAGIRDVEGESAVATGARELAEEAGLGGGELTELGTFWVSPGWSTERATFVLATDVGPVEQPDGYEAHGEEAELEVLHMSREEAVAAVVANEIEDATSALAIMLAAARGWSA